MTMTNLWYTLGLGGNTAAFQACLLGASFPQSGRHEEHGGAKAKGTLLPSFQTLKEQQNPHATARISTPADFLIDEQIFTIMPQISLRICESIRIKHACQPGLQKLKVSVICLDVILTMQAATGKNS